MTLCNESTETSIRQWLIGGDSRVLHWMVHERCMRTKPWDHTWMVSLPTTCRFWKGSLEWCWQRSTTTSNEIPALHLPLTSRDSDLGSPSPSLLLSECLFHTGSSCSLPFLVAWFPPSLSWPWPLEPTTFDVPVFTFCDREEMDDGISWVAVWVMVANSEGDKGSRWIDFSVNTTAENGANVFSSCRRRGSGGSEQRRTWISSR